MEADPFELNNLAKDPGYASVIDRVRQKLRVSSVEVLGLTAQ